LKKQAPAVFISAISFRISLFRDDFQTALGLLKKSRLLNVLYFNSPVLSYFKKHTDYRTIRHPQARQILAIWRGLAPGGPANIKKLSIAGFASR
jgi:hypothetical protein